jgi:hypothetical protein
MAVCAASVTAQQYCGEGSVAHAVQVTFAGCGDVPDNVSVYIGSNIGELLPLVKAPSGYWEADRENFAPLNLRLCSPECSGKIGCAGFREMVAIDRGPHHRVCAARYIIHCTEAVWKLHVETEPGRFFVAYKRLTPGGTAPQQQVTKRTPFDLCDLGYKEKVELQLQGTVSITLKAIDVGLFERGQTIKVSRDELARGLQRPLSPEERKRLPEFVTLTIIDR